ncbi:MAG: Mur ligase domain-containing protein [Ferruginibacter sp.]
MITSIDDFENVFFIGVAGTGMSALAQYLAGVGKKVSGSDRYFVPREMNDTKQKLEAAGINCFTQNGTGVNAELQLVIVSTAVEDTVPEVQKAKELNIPIIKRSELLALIAKSKKTIAVAGTSGKSTTSAMLFEILKHAGMQPGIISGAGLVSIIKEGKIGNAEAGAGEWLVIEADESDGSIVQYHPEVGLLLNVDKDHQEIEELMHLFEIFKNNTRGLFIVNQSNSLSKKLSGGNNKDFSSNSAAGFSSTDFIQEGFNIRFKINGVDFNLNTVGKHNMENALAATSVAVQIGVSLETCATALRNYEGIYRRHQVLGQKNGVWVIDDYAHNPAKCAASIAACQALSPKVIAWFQPHGYGPTRFLKDDFVKEIAAVLRPEDEIWMSEIFYAGGTAVKDISANDLIKEISALGKNAFFQSDRNTFLEAVRSHFTDSCVLLLMGARDPGLEQFSKNLWQDI